MAKLVYFTRELDSADQGGRLNFIKFETHRIDLCIDFIKQLKDDHEKLNGSAPDELCVVATGGGAYKYYDRLKEALNVDIRREDEMECLIAGESSTRQCARMDSDAFCVHICRPGFLHHRNPERSVHVQ